jgi:hypothetical protein
MPLRRQITCITKRDRNNPHERIEGVGGAQSGAPWYLPEDQAIRGIENGSMSFYTHVGRYTADVVVAVHLGRKYLKTTADGYSPDNLLSLSSCPISRAA